MYGYGNEELFSPLRAETSFNENPYNSQKESRNVSEFLQGQSSLIIENGMEDLIMCQKKNNFFENTDGPKIKVNGSKEQLSLNASKIYEDSSYKTAIQNEFLSALSYEDLTFGNSIEKDFSIEIGTKRCRSSSQSGKEYQDGSSPKYTNSSNSTQKSKQAKHYYNEGLKNYVSPRSENHKTKEQFDKLSAKCAKYPSNNLLCCTEKKEVEVIDLESIDICETSSEKSQLVPVNTEKSQLLGNEWDGVNEIAFAPKQIAQDFNFEGKNMFSSAVPNYYSQQQVQTSIVEKLIKDTVSFEFDAIRQLLYLQYICLSRHLHQTQEILGNVNSSSCEFMLKVIEELMQENRLLKKAVVAHQRRT